MAIATVPIACSNAVVVTGDAGTDSSVLAPEPFCASRPNLQFCEDFDGAGLPGQFTEKTELGGTFAVDTSTWSSPSKALLVKTVAGASETKIVLTKAFAAGKKLRLFGQIYVEQRSELSSSLTEVYALNFVENGATYRVGIAVSGTGAWFAFEEGALATPIASTFAASTAVPEKEWTSLRLDVDFEAVEKGTLSVKVGSDTVVEKASLRPPFITQGPTLAVGLRSVSPASGEWRVRFDTLNFAID